MKPTETYKLFEQGVVVGRDGFEDTSAMFTFRSAQGNQSTWNHPDTNTFGFWAKGEAFVVDAGAGYKAGWQHNIVMADGVGLDAEGGSYNCPGRIVKTEDLGNAVYVLGDATESYKNKVKAIKADRHAVFGRGENPYVFTYDDFSIDGAEHAYAVHYMTNGDNELVLLEDASGYQIKGGNIGGQCFALFFDDKDVNVALEDVNESFKSTVAQVSDTNLSMGALFIAADRYGKLPTVRKTMTENGMKLELYLADNRLDVITVENGVASYESTVYTEKPAGDGVIDLSVYETEVELTDITVTTLPQKTEYTEGESFDKTGMVVTAHYSDGSTRTVADYTIDKTGALKVTDTEILITYAEKGIEKNAIVAIKVSPGIHETEVELTDITVTTLPQKTEYTEGESFDKTGMVVTAHYSDGSTRIVADYTIDKTGALKVTDTEILITYAEKGIEKTIAVAIKVSPNQQNNNDNNGSGNEDNKENDSTGNLPDNGEGKLSPQTGAESRLLLWLGMAFFAGTALVFLFLSRKKKDR